MQRLLLIVLAAWAGSLWTVCGMVAPTLFAALPDRALAGEVAGRFFRIESWLGLALGLVALLLLRKGAAHGAKRLDYGIVTATMLAPLASEALLRPMMSSARAVGDMQRFGMLHGVSALLFGVACVGTLALLWRSSAPRAS